MSDIQEEGWPFRTYLPSYLRAFKCNRNSFLTF